MKIRTGMHRTTWAFQKYALATLPCTTPKLIQGNRRCRGITKLNIKAFCVGNQPIMLFNSERKSAWLLYSNIHDNLRMIGREKESHPIHKYVCVQCVYNKERNSMIEMSMCWRAALAICTNKFRGSFLFPFRYYYCITLQHYGNASYRIRFSGTNYKYFFFNVGFYVNVCAQGTCHAKRLSLFSAAKQNIIAWRIALLTTQQLNSTHAHMLNNHRSGLQFSNLFTKVNLNKLNFVRIELVLNFWYDCIIYVFAADCHNWPANNTCMDGRLTVVCVCLFWATPAWLLPH